MKKFFQRLDNSSNYQRDYQREGSAASNSSNSSSFIGKVFTLGQYSCTVEDTIAEGGFALVFLVKAQNGVRYALKRLHVNNEQDLANCKREIEIAKKVGSHKNVVLLVESMISQTRNGAFQILLLMQHCKGQLLQLMNERIGTGFSEEEIVRILCDVCEAIARLHQNDPPIIHRDLKVENILISENGIYLLCDFGSATTKVLSASESGHSAMVIEDEIKRYTTLAYRSPEMVDVYSGKPITTKSDIWALGCLLYKICFFNLPFGESTLAIQNAQLTIPDSHADRYSRRLLALIGYMLLPDPQDRPDIFQVSTLAFELAGAECPVKNANNSKIPVWTELRVPPTESHARELKKAAAATVIVNSHAVQSQIESERSTSVAPRQRPKASININSVLPTSPVAFQRAVTPIDPVSGISTTTTSSSSSSNTTTTSTTLSTTLTVKDSASVSTNMTNSHSFSSSGQLFSGKMENEKTDWAGSGSNTKNAKHSQFSSNPQLNNNNASSSSASNATESSATFPTVAPALSSKNPFISSLSGDDDSPPGTATSLPPPPLPRPPSNTRRTQTPPGITLNSAYSQNFLADSSSSANNLPSSTNFHHHHHRRNMSDTSAFNSKDMGVGGGGGGVGGHSSTAATTSFVTTSQASSLNITSKNFAKDKLDGAGPGSSAGGGNSQRVRSLNPFEDPNDYSYEDQLFGHEFDKIRMENQQEITTTVCDGSGNNVTTSSTATSNYDPFEAVPFNTDRLKRYFERQQSDLQLRQQQQSSASNRPMLINVTSTSLDDSCSGTKSAPTTSAAIPCPTNPNQNTVITIRSNNDFTITNSNQSNELKPESLARISIATDAAAAAAAAAVPMNLGDQTSKVTDKSISSSSQGNNAFSPATHYMPLYSSDTAEDDDDDDDEDGYNSNGDDDDGEDDEDRLDHDRHQFETPADLTKPLVDNDEDEEDEDDQDEDPDDIGEESSIGTASDLQQSDDSDEETNDDDDDDEHNSNVELEQNDRSDSSDDELDNDDGNSDDGFELVDFDGNLNSTKFRYGLVINAEPIPTKPVKTSAVNSGNGIDLIGKESLLLNNTGNKLASNISRIQIGQSTLDTYSCDTASIDQANSIDDGTSVGEVLSNCSVSSKNVDTIDHLIGHIEGNRPLLDDEDEDDNEQLSSNTTIKPFIEVDELIEIPIQSEQPSNQSYSMSSSIHSTNSVIQMSVNEPPTAIVQSNNSFVFARKESFPNETSQVSAVSSSANNKSGGGGSDLNQLNADFESLSLQQIVDESEENRRLDEEVAQSLNSQVLLDQLVNKDLFGSIPFTDEELMNKNKKLQLQQLQKKNSKPEATTTTSSDITTSKSTALKFENSFTEPAKKPSTGQDAAPPAVTAKSPPKPYTIPKTNSDTTIASNLFKSTDLFGAVPFSAGAPQAPSKAPETHYRKTSQPTLSTTTASVTIKPKPLPLNLPLKQTTQSSSFVTKPTLVTASAASSKSATTALAKKLPDTKLSQATSQVSAPATSSNPVSILTGSLGRLGKNQVQKSNSKLKSKVAKKYEVVESDDDVDGLLDDGLLEDENEQLGLKMPDLNSKDKKKKKDKKEKEKPEKKPKEKKEDKKSKSKEKPEKEKKSNEKSKDKEKSSKSKEKEKEKLSKAELKAKEKKELNSKSSSKISDEIAGAGVGGSVISLKLTKTLSSTVNPVDSVGLSSIGKSSKSDSKSKADKKKELKHKNKHQAFANMSFEDEREHHQPVPSSSGSSSAASIVSHSSVSVRQAVAARLSLPKLHSQSVNPSSASSTASNSATTITKC